MASWKRQTVSAGVVLASVVLASPMNAADHQKITTGQLSGEAVAEPPGTRRIQDETLRASLPIFRVRVLLRDGAELPFSLEKYVVRRDPENVTWLKSSPTYDLRPGDREALAAAVKAEDVHVVELLPANHLPPIENIFPAQFNLDARLSHFVNQFEGLHGGQGASVTVAVIDGGSVRATHVEFQPGRVTLREQGRQESAHATHVAGTIGASGLKTEARGMAPKVKILSHTYFDDDLDKLNAVAANTWVSNHSYGPYTGWAQLRLSSGLPAWAWFGDTSVDGQGHALFKEDANFGKYTVDCRRLDEILHAHDELLSVVAAGNDRDDGPANQPIQHIEWFAGEPKWSGEVRSLDGYKDGYDTITGLGISKNALCVGAINDLFSDGQPIPGASIMSTFFSSWGPTDDGRIKPDVVANGQGLLSPTTPPTGASKPDEAYEEMSGTSMASPTAAGIASIVAEHYRAAKGRRAKSAELKALLVHSTTDAGPPGPDAMFGYGSLNAFRAGEIIQGADGQVIQHHSVGSGSTKQFTWQRTSGPVRVTIAWLDPPAEPNASGLNDRTPVLQHNLDLRVEDAAGEAFHPYRLDPGNPLRPALNDGPNGVDNVEVVDVAAASASGNWNVFVVAAGLPPGTQQDFAIVATGLKE